jgi:hypothetical protein
MLPSAAAGPIATHCDNGTKQLIYTLHEEMQYYLKAIMIMSQQMFAM